MSGYNVGCLFARLAGEAEGASRDKFIGKAMAWLKKAAASGYPATAEQVDEVQRKDEDLDALRPAGVRRVGRIFAANKK